MLRTGIRYSNLLIILTSLLILLAGCAAGIVGGSGAQWSPETFEKDGYHIHYARPPMSKWAVFEDPELEIAFYNKETGTVFSFDSEHHTEETDLKKAFHEFQKELQSTFQGKLTVLEEAAQTVLGQPGYHAKVEGIREKSNSKIYFLHYFLSKDRKIMTFDFTQPAEVEAGKRQQDLDTFLYFMNSFQIH